MTAGNYVGIAAAVLLLGPFAIWILAWLLHLLILSLRYAGSVISEAWNYPFD